MPSSPISPGSATKLASPENRKPSAETTSTCSVGMRGLYRASFVLFLVPLFPGERERLLRAAEAAQRSELRGQRDELVLCLREIDVAVRVLQRFFGQLLRFDGLRFIEVLRGSRCRRVPSPCRV